MNSRDFQDRYGPWALVAGASEGLGAEFARQIAGRGVNLLVIAHHPAPLDEVASEIRAAHGVEVRTAVLDLASPSVDRELGELMVGLDIGLLVYNAAFSPIGRFVEQDLADKERALDVNCRGPLVFVHRLAPPMVGRGRGGIVLLASMAAFHGTAMVATYAATKAFNLVLAEGLWSELAESGVDVLACCPGPTRTPGYMRSNPQKDLHPMEPGPVVTEALAALGLRSSMIAGRSNRFTALLLSRLLPRQAAVRLMSGATRRLYRGAGAR